MDRNLHRLHRSLAKHRRRNRHQKQINKKTNKQKTTTTPTFCKDSFKNNLEALEKKTT